MKHSILCLLRQCGQYGVTVDPSHQSQRTMYLCVVCAQGMRVWRVFDTVGEALNAHSNIHAYVHIYMHTVCSGLYLQMYVHTYICT